MRLSGSPELASPATEEYMVHRHSLIKGKSLIEFTNDVGIPERLIMDGTTEFTGQHTEFVKEVR
jgi:DNA-binding transcriptional regulator PaaX